MLKLIMVNMVGWRCGSSMMTGFLEKLGADLGDHKGRKKRTTPNPLNPFGSFENKALLKFQKRLIAKHWSIGEQPVAPKGLKRIAEDNLEEFESTCEEQFGDEGVAACKCMMCTLIPFSMLSKKIEPLVIWIDRPLIHEANSLASIAQRPVQPILDWLRMQKEWTRDFLASENPPLLRVGFDAMLQYPIINAKKVCDFTGLPYPGDDVVRKWVHPEFSRFTKK